MRIIETNKNIYNEQYLDARDNFWDEKVSEYNENNTPLWNGDVYYLEEARDDSVKIGLCEYKDLVFIEEFGVEDTKNKYGLNFDFVYINVQILISPDGNIFLFGTQNHPDHIKIISVGGTLRLEDENKISSIEDITSYSIKELEIETNIEVHKSNLEFVDIIVNDNICTFLYIYTVDKLRENMLKIGEFDGEICIDKNKIHTSTEYVLDARLMSIHDYL